MGNFCSASISCDAIFSRCLDCTSRKVAYIIELEDNLDALRTKLEKLQEARNDLLRRIELAEKKRKKRTDQVQGWLSRVRDVEAEVNGLLENRSREVEKLFFGGYCSKNCKSSYKFGKKVANKLTLVATLTGEGVFEVVAENVPDPVAEEKPREPTIVGLQLILDQVWRCIEEEQVGIIGLYGMGGVGKTTLLTEINNKFLDISNNYDIVIWVVVSRDLQVEKIQERIGQKIGFDGESWKNKTIDEKASDIFNILRKKKFVVLLDDIWDRVDLIKVGIPLSRVEAGCKIVFTTRFLNVCGLMEANRKFKVECLSEEEAWELFQAKVGRETLDSHPGIVELAKLVAKECGGLPLALITIGRAMAYKKTPEEWEYAIQVLSRASSKFPGMEKEVYPLLKFSYDCLPNDKIRSCLLYCSLFPEDFSIIKTKLIDYWFCENFLDVYDPSEVYSHGYYIIGVLVHACLLEEVEERGDYFVKMHDVIRDMTLWIACEIEEQQKFLVQVGVGLTKAPKVKEWEELKRMSLMENKIEELSVTPTCPDLLTLFLNSNNLNMISNSFFQFMPSLKVLNLSYNGFLFQLPSGISNLVSLHHLDLSWSSIRELPMELTALAKLKCLSLEYTYMLCKIPSQLISKFSELHILRMIGCGYHEVEEDSVLFGGGENLVEELLDLESLKVLSITLKSGRALQTFLSSNKFQNSTHGLTLRHLDDCRVLNVLSLADLKHLRRLEIEDCDLEELKIEHLRVVQKTREPYNFRGLNRVQIVLCSRIRDLTWLVFVPNLKYLNVSRCNELEEIISDRKLGEEYPEMMENLNLFAKLHFINIRHLPNLKSIYWKGLPLPHLNQFYVLECPKLKKLPLDSNSAKGQKIAIIGSENWWERLEWESEADQNAFLPYFQSH